LKKSKVVQKSPKGILKIKKKWVEFLPHFKTQKFSQVGAVSDFPAAYPLV
jgi:hypothetical protein